MARAEKVCYTLRRFDLSLTEDEARALYEALLHIAGDTAHSRRAFTERIRGALETAGLERERLPDCSGTILFEYNHQAVQGKEDALEFPPMPPHPQFSFY